MADHNDPNAVNTIFSDIDVSGADLYDLFGFPSSDKSGGEKVVIALTFAATPDTGVLDPDILYRVRIAPAQRVPKTAHKVPTLESLMEYFVGVKDKYLGNFKPLEIRVKVDAAGKASVKFFGFSSGDFATTIDTNQVKTIATPDGHSIQAYVGGREEAFFNDLPGFFRSINYAPQFYHVPHSMTEARELKIPKTLLELEGNDLFNFDPAQPQFGKTEKRDLPPGPWEWKGDKFKKDEKGNFRFVYDGEDARAGKNCNAIIFEIPMAFLTKEPEKDRIVNAWGESWVLKAANKIETIPDEPLWHEHPFAFLQSSHQDEELKKYKLVDTDGLPFADAALSERENNRQMGANNFFLAPHFIKRLAHLGWGFGPSIDALGVKTSFDHDHSPVSVHKVYSSVLEAFPRTIKTLFQELNMPDDSWNPKNLEIPLRRSYEIFVPNVCAIDMDTTGTWPFGRRPEDQVATRFLSLFLDHSSTVGGKKVHVDTLSDQALWDGAPITPKTPPNPLKNDKEFLSHFPYLAEPW